MPTLLEQPISPLSGAPLKAFSQEQLTPTHRLRRAPREIRFESLMEGVWSLNLAIFQDSAGLVRAVAGSYHSGHVAELSPFAFGLFFIHGEESFAAPARAFLEELVGHEAFYQIALKSIQSRITPELLLEEFLEEFGPRKGLTTSYAAAAMEAYAACFPIYSEYLSRLPIAYDGHYGYMTSNTAPRDFQHARTHRELVELTLGGSYRKDIARELYRLRDPEAFYLVAGFRTVMSFDELAIALSEVEAGSLREALLMPWGAASASRELWSDILTETREREVLEDTWELTPLSTLSPTLRRRLFKEALSLSSSEAQEAPMGVDFSTARDTLELVELVQNPQAFKGARSWREVHDRALKLVAGARSDERKVKFPPELQSLAKLSFPAGYILKYLESQGEFIATGEVMDICIGALSYFKRGLKGESYCLRFDTPEGNMASAMELKYTAKGWSVVQLRGYSNAVPPHHGELMALLQAHFLAIAPKQGKQISEHLFTKEAQEEVAALRANAREVVTFIV